MSEVPLLVTDVAQNAGIGRQPGADEKKAVWVS